MSDKEENLNRKNSFLSNNGYKSSNKKLIFLKYSYSNFFRIDRKYVLKWFRYISFPFIWKKHIENLIIKRKIKTNNGFENKIKNIIQVLKIFNYK